MHVQGLILKESKDSLELVIELENRATGDTPTDEALRKQAAQIRENIAAKEAKAL
jgi:hypothetical protein